MSTDDTSATAAAGPVLSEGLGPLREAADAVVGPQTHGGNDGNLG